MNVGKLFSHRFFNPLEWRSGEKALLLQFMSLILHVQYTLWGQYLMNMEGRDELVNVAQLSVLLDHFYILVAISVAMLLGIFALWKLSGSRLWYEYVAAIYYGLSLCYFSYTIGTLTLPTGAAMAGAPVVGFILFNRGAVLTALLLSLIVHIGTSYLTVLGYLPYAPIVNQSYTVDGQLSLFWMTMMYVFMAPHLVLMILLAYYVLKRWRQREDEVRLLSMTDPLTGLSNRRSILSHLNREQERSSRQGPPLSVLMIDLDHFKQINDRFGHPVGDQVLTSAGRVLHESVRQNDWVGRFGGEEFLVVLPGTDAVGAALLAERCRERICAMTIDSGTGETLRVTASLGLFCNEPDRTVSVEDMLRLADEALYEAKRQGRNRVVINDGASSRGMTESPA